MKIAGFSVAQILIALAVIAGLVVIYKVVIKK